MYFKLALLALLVGQVWCGKIDFRVGKKERFAPMWRRAAVNAKCFGAREFNMLMRKIASDRQFAQAFRSIAGNTRVITFRGWGDALLGAAGDMLGDNVGDLLGNIGNVGNVGDLLSNVGNVGNVGDLLSNVGNVGNVGDLLSNVGNVGDIMGNAGDLVGNVGDFIGDAAGDAFDQASDFGGGIIDQIGGFAAGIGNVDMIEPECGMIPSTGDANRMCSGCRAGFQSKMFDAVFQLEVCPDPDSGVVPIELKFNDETLFKKEQKFTCAQDMCMAGIPIPLMPGLLDITLQMCLSNVTFNRQTGDFSFCARGKTTIGGVGSKFTQILADTSGLKIPNINFMCNTIPGGIRVGEDSSSSSSSKESSSSSSESNEQCNCQAEVCPPSTGGVDPGQVDMFNDDDDNQTEPAPAPPVDEEKAAEEFDCARMCPQVAPAPPPGPAPVPAKPDPIGTGYVGNSYMDFFGYGY